MRRRELAVRVEQAVAGLHKSQVLTLCAEPLCAAIQRRLTEESCVSLQNVGHVEMQTDVESLSFRVDVMVQVLPARQGETRDVPAVLHGRGRMLQSGEALIYFNRLTARKINPSAT